MQGRNVPFKRIKWRQMIPNEKSLKIASKCEKKD